MSDTGRWALNHKGQARYTQIEPDASEYFPAAEVKVEKSAVKNNERAVFLAVCDNEAGVYMHLSADDAESMATVLLYLADQWRKENPNE